MSIAYDTVVTLTTMHQDFQKRYPGKDIKIVIGPDKQDYISKGFKEYGNFLKHGYELYFMIKN